MVEWQGTFSYTLSFMLEGKSRTEIFRIRAGIKSKLYNLILVFIKNPYNWIMRINDIDKRA